MHSYPSIYHLGHRAVKDIFSGSVVVQEKIDGSQISFCLTPPTDSTADEYALRIRSKGAVLNIVAPDKLFAAGVAAIQAIAPKLTPGWVYRGEYLAKPKHNALAYDRVPQNHVILFDIERGDQDFLDPAEVLQEANRIGLEYVPLIGLGAGWDLSEFRGLLERTSVLGGQKIEGIVVKNYQMFGPDKKVLMAKFVSEAFKEVHAAEWKKANPAGQDIIDRLIVYYRTPARWAKAVQHLRERGLIEDAPSDIGRLFPEVAGDIAEEYREAIEDILFEWAWPKISRGVTVGLAEWYKEQLLAKQFEEDKT